MNWGGNIRLKKGRSHSFTHDTTAVSETFTILPALSMVLIGFTIFSMIIAAAYTSFETKDNYTDMFEQSNNILEKISSPNACFTTDGNSIDYSLFSSEQANEYISLLQSEFSPYHLSFSVKLSFADEISWLPTSNSMDQITGNRYASSKQVSVRMNEVKTVPGILTVFLFDTAS
jgi:hypothetical protein